jgi:uncharacterized SAM-binding protein YcdF (DUF218 family)
VTLLSPHVRRAGIAIIVCIVLFAAAAGPSARFLIVRSEPLAGDAIIVLAGSPLYDERIQHAIELFTLGRARSIVLTNDGVRGGWSRRHQRNLPPIERGRDALLDAGIDENRVVLLTGRVRSTYDEAIALREIAKTRAIRSVVIVTSPYHSRRAFWIFRRILASQGVQVGIDPVPPGRLSPDPETWWTSRRGWYGVPLEYVKLAYYLVRHA